MAEKSTDAQYVITVIGDQTCGVPIHSVFEMVPMPKISSVPGCEAFIRGVVNLRGAVMPVVDMRTRLGTPSCAVEAAATIQMIDQRETDHRRWLEELEKSITEKKPFTLATDPHECAFGKWYYAYDAKTGSNRCMALDLILPKFETPHDRIHAIAEQVLAMEKAGDFDGAMALIDETRNGELRQMIALFEEARQVIRAQRRELAMVVEIDGSRQVLAVDAVDAIDHLDVSRDNETGVAGAFADDPLVAGIGHRRKDSSLVIVLNPDRIASADAPATEP